MKRIVETAGYLFVVYSLLFWTAIASGVTGTALQSSNPLTLDIPANKYFNDIYIDVLSGATKLTVTLSGGSGNLDLFVKLGAPLSGSTFTAVQADADISATGPAADESIVLTPTSTPALQAGRWYIGPANRNSDTTTSTLTATVEGVPKHQIALTVGPPGVYVPGNAFSWNFDITPAVAGSVVDLYAAVTPPGGGLLFLGSSGEFTDQIEPLQIGIPLDESQSGTFLFQYPGPGTLPEGEYHFFAGLVNSGTFPLTESNWMSNLATASAHLSRLSPPQKVYIASRGYPEQFIKTFAQEEGRTRIDESWFYVALGKAATFVDGVLVKESDLQAGALQAGALGVHPEDYTWDTTVNDVTARHGQPTQTLGSAPGSGAFYSVFPADTYYVYSDIVFGFDDNALVSVVAIR